MNSIYLVLTFCHTFVFDTISGQWIVLSLFINGLSIDKPIFGKHHLKDKTSSGPNRPAAAIGGGVLGGFDFGHFDPC